MLLLASNMSRTNVQILEKDMKGKHEAYIESLTLYELALKRTYLERGSVLLVFTAKLKNDN